MGQDLKTVIAALKAQSKPENLAGMKRYGIKVDNALGLSMPVIREAAKKIGTDHALALQLWQTGIHDARILAGLVADPKQITDAQMENWVMDFDSWDVCDQVCGSVFEKSPLAWRKVAEWAARDEEFVKRAAFALLASLAWHDKKATDEQFVKALPLILKASTDDRNFVKKAVNWALRNIGKKNFYLNKEALRSAQEIQKIDSKAARWVAVDALRELQSEAVQNRLQHR
ncbi:MAG TPA: DNA alkylation repair protein [Dehalococcoidales bacterium]|nr:DNA alkylation repair protein [Dehalococcoidales bacterium]